MLRENKLIIGYVFALNILLLIPSALSPIFKQVFTDYILTDGVSEWLTPLLLLMTGTALLSASVTWMQKNCLLRLSNKIEIAGAGKYIWALLRAPLGLFHEKDSYRLLLQADASKGISKLLTRDLLTLMFNIVSVAFYLFMMLRLDPLMSAVVVALVMLNFCMLKLQTFLSKKLVKKDESAPNPRDLMMQEERVGAAGLEHIETFKSTASETFFFQRLLGTKMSIINAKEDEDFEKACEPLETLPEVIFLNLLLLISAFRIMDRSFTIGTYLAFQAYASAFFSPLNEVLAAHDLFGKFEKRLKGLFKELDSGKREKQTPPVPAESAESAKSAGSADPAQSAELADPAQSAGSAESAGAAHPVGLAQPTGKLDGYIEVKNLCFGYNPEVPVLQDINLSLKPGQRIAIVGNSGAGKTTLLSLLQGVYEPDIGEITIDGVRPSALERRVFAYSIGCANQEVTLFAASVRDNITLWDESITDAEVYRAASDAHIHDYIASLNGAYSYFLSEHGNNLSGGQRQQLEIARALLYNPTLVVLDEATSSIDPVSRRIIEENLLKRGCTCIAATHILSAVTDYDEIIVLEKGRIVERGTHEELLRASVLYASVFREEVSMGV